MMRQKLTYLVVLSFLFNSCGPQGGPGSSVLRQNMSQNTESVGINDQGQPVVTYGSSPMESQLRNLRDQDLADSIREDIRRRKEEFRSQVSEEEFLDFESPEATFKDDGTVSVKLNVVFSKDGVEKSEPITFEMPPREDFKEDFMFKQTSGFEMDKETVTMQGMCMDVSCDEIVIQPAYYLKDKKVVKQFTIERPSDEVLDVIIHEEHDSNQEPQETDDDVTVKDSDLSVNIKDEPAEESFSPDVMTEAPESISKNNVNIVDEADVRRRESFSETDSNPSRVSPQRPQSPQAETPPQRPDDLNPPVQVQQEAPEREDVSNLDAEESPDVPSSNFNAPEVSRVPPQKPQNLSRSEERPSGERPEGVDSRPSSLRPQPRPESLNVHRREREEDPEITSRQSPAMPSKPELPETSDIDVQTQAPEMGELNLNEEDIQSPDISVAQDARIESRRSPERPEAVENRDSLPEVHDPSGSENHLHNSAAPERSLRPKSRPEFLGASPQAVARSLRPKPRVDRLKDFRIDPELELDDFKLTPNGYLLSNGEQVNIPHGEETTVSTEHFHLPSIDPRDRDYNSVFSLNAGMVYELSLTRTAVEDETLSKVLNEFYHQSFNKHTDGYLRNAVQLPDDILGARVHPGRRSKQWASGLTVNFVKYISSRYEAIEPDAPVCVHNLSQEGGGQMSSHSSHKNGLDIDIAYPSSPNSCSGGGYFSHWSTLKDRDEDFFNRNWKFLKFMLVDDAIKERVRIIFSDKPFMRGLCRWAKNNGKNNEDLESILEKLYHERNHHHHYHIRLKCNHQNKNCKPSPYYTRRSKKVSAQTCQ